MADETPKDPTAAFAEELAKQLPVKAIYEDAAKPAATQVGQIAQDLVKTIQLALAPLQFLGAFQDRLRAFIDRSVRAVPEEKRVSPAPQILGPIVEAIRYEPEGTPIDQMFSALLSSSMNSDRVADAHPALPLIIKQLSVDEALILQRIATSDVYYELVFKFELSGALSIQSLEQSALPLDGLLFPKNEQMYRDHLDRLGLIRYDMLKPMEPIREHGPQIGGRQTGGRNFFGLKLTELGAALMRASGFPPKLPV
jgi:hypothetical protein